jgi:hypothetical protein
MMSKQQSKPRLRLTLRLIYFVPVFLLAVAGICMFIFNFGTPKQAKAATETMTTGSFIINMGVTPQTYSNGLKPYGMIYDLMVNYNVPIKWVIEPTKIKDGADFTYSATQYKGGTFIVPKEYITSSVTTRITYWTGQGVQGVYTTSPINVPVYATITNWPKLMIDNVSGNENIIIGYFTNALLPAASYSVGTPSLLTNCSDMWANPHGDPTWATHGYLYNLTTVAKSYIWMECHAVSVTEGVQNPSAPFERLNFLTTNGLQCYSNNKCGAAVTQNHAGNPNTPFTHYFPTDPVMQFMGTMDGATGGGSEKWYIPQSIGGGAWRATSKRCVITSDGVSPNEGVEMVYGPAFGNPVNGMVMYEGGHDIDGNGSTAEKVAAQRAFFNFLLLAGIAKQISFDTQSSPSSLMGNETGSCAVTTSGGTPGFTYAWSSTVGGSFTSTTAASTTFKAPVVASVTTGNLICVVTDACGRQNFVSRPITISTAVLPIELKSLDAALDGSKAIVSWTTASEVNNDYFTIERSTNGTDYTNIGHMPGSGNSTVDKHYSFTDDHPALSYNYYRLKQTDYDGTTKTYGPVYVKLNKIGAEFAIHDAGPNPFNDKLKINFTAEKNCTVYYYLVNSAGAVVRSETILATEGENDFELTGLEAIPSGIYFAIIANGSDKKVVKVLKSH